MHLRKVLREDLYDFSRVVGLAMWNDEIMAYTAPYRDQYPDSFFNHVLYRTKVRWYRGESFFLAVSDSDDPDWSGQEVIMGYCIYSTTVEGHQKPLRSGWLGNAFERLAVSCWGQYEKSFGLDRSCNQAAEDHFRKVISSDPWVSYFESLPDTHKEKHGNQHWELELLGTHPNFRRRGVGKMCLQWGFEQAARDNVPLILISSVAGEKLYLSTGFTEVGRLTMLPNNDNMQNLGPGTDQLNDLTWATMIWEPKGMHE